MARIVDRTFLGEVLRDIADEFGEAGRLYLTGSAALIFEGLRSASVDIDYAPEIAPPLLSRFEESVRTVSRKRDVILEVVTIGGWIVLPPGWEGRCRYLATYGALDVYAFDPYSLCLSKLLRGRAPDLQDVAALARAGHVDLDRLADMARWLAAQWSPMGWHGGAGDRETLRAKLDGHFAELQHLAADA